MWVKKRRARSVSCREQRAERTKLREVAPMLKAIHASEYVAAGMFGWVGPDGNVSIVLLKANVNWACCTCDREDPS